MAQENMEMPLNWLRNLAIVISFPGAHHDSLQPCYQEYKIE